MERTLIQQIEFYFSNINLSQDKYLLKQMDSNGMIPITIILSFKKIQKYFQNMDGTN